MEYQWQMMTIIIAIIIIYYYYILYNNFQSYIHMSVYVMIFSFVRRLGPNLASGRTSHSGPLVNPRRDEQQRNEEFMGSNAGVGKCRFLGDFEYHQTKYLLEMKYPQ